MLQQAWRLRVVVLIYSASEAIAAWVKSTHCRKLHTGSCQKTRAAPSCRKPPLPASPPRPPRPKPSSHASPHQAISCNPPGTCLQVLKRIPKNDVTTEYAAGMAAAVCEYNSSHGLSHQQSIILFVVQPNDKNSHDQQVHCLCSLAPFGAHAGVWWSPSLSSAHSLLSAVWFCSKGCCPPGRPMSACALSCSFLSTRHDW